MLPRAPALLAVGVRLGLVLGVMLGVLRGGLHLWSNHYLEAGLFRIALLDLGERTIRSTLWALGIALAVAVVALLVRAPLARALERSGQRDRVEWLAARLRWSHGRDLALTALVALALVCAGAYAARLRVRDEGPNLLLLTADTLRADHLGSYGYVRPTSPRLDALAASGTRFTHGIVQWPKTSPSLASLLTSTYGHENGVMRSTPFPIGERHLLLAELLRNAGYRTVGIVSNGGLAADLGYAQGFETFVEMWRRSRYNVGGRSWNERTRAGNLVDAALDWLRDHGREAPFFLWIHLVDPHDPYDPPAPYHGMFVGDAHYREDRILRRNEGRSDYMGGLAARLVVGDELNADWYVAQHDAEIRYMDAEIGRLLDGLADLQLAAETAVFFTADHGESLGDHDYWFAHGKLPYDACSRVPLVVRLPAGSPSAPRVVEDPVELIHLAPTILDLAGLEPPPRMRGVSLLPLLRGEPEGLPRYAFTESGYARDYMRAIRDRRWKLIYVPSEKDRGDMRGRVFELYDLASDPDEREDLSEAEPPALAELRSALFTWMVEGAVPEGRPPEARPELDAETRRNLEALGYLE